MARTESAQAIYTRMRNDETAHCWESRDWLRAHPRLVTAWRACKNGNWMAWWLWGLNAVNFHTELKQYLPVGVYRDMFTGSGWEQWQREQFADNLRRAYNSSGSRRTA